MFLSILFILSASSSYESKLEELSQEVKELKESVKALQALLIKPHENVDDAETNGWRLPPTLTIYPFWFWRRRSSNNIPARESRLPPARFNARYYYGRVTPAVYKGEGKATSTQVRARSSQKNATVMC